MEIMMKILLLSLVILWLCKITPGLYTILFNVKRFDNPGHKSFDGTNCDPYLTSRCEHTFWMCPDFLSGSLDNHDKCRDEDLSKIAWKTPQEIQVKKPWKGKIPMKITVYDEDTVKDDLVDRISGIIQLDVYRGRREAKTTALTLNGTHTSLILMVAVYCNLNWIGPNCSCNGSNPRYTCYNNGTKVCNRTWYGPECDVKCWPKKGIYDHYNCSSNGTKVCHEHYYGKDCAIHCKPQNHYKAGYTCDQNGSRICEKNWCTEHCNFSCPESNTLSTTLVTIDGTSRGNSETKTKAGQGTNGNVDNQTGKPHVIPIIGGVVGVLLLLVAIGLGVFCYKRKQKKGENGRNETVSMQGLAASAENNNGGVIYDEINHDENLYEDAVAVTEQLYEDPNEANAADTYAVPDKKRGKSLAADPDNVSDSVLIMENECYGSASEAGQTRPQNVGAAANASDDVLIMDNELYGAASDIQETVPKKATAARDSSDDVLIVDNELYG